MGAHFKQTEEVPSSRRRRLGVLCIALGVGLLAFAFVDEDGTPVDTPPSPTSAPTVLGAVVDRSDATASTLAGAAPAVPATFDTSTEDSAPSTTARPRTTTSAAPTRRGTTTTTEAATLIPPTVVTNTTTSLPPRPTTTTTEPTTSSTTTTEATTSSTAPGSDD